MGWGTRDKSIGKTLWWAKQTPIHHNIDCPSEELMSFCGVLFGVQERCYLPPQPILHFWCTVITKQRFCVFLS